MNGRPEVGWSRILGVSRCSPANTECLIQNAPVETDRTLEQRKPSGALRMVTPSSTNQCVNSQKEENEWTEMN